MVNKCNTFDQLMPFQQKIMIAVRHGQLEESKSVNRLLEISQMKHYLEQMEAEKSQQLISNYNDKNTPHSVRHKPLSRHQSVSLHKQYEYKARHFDQPQREEHNDQFQRSWHQQDEHENACREHTQENTQQLKSARLPFLSQYSSTQDQLMSFNSNFHAQTPAQTSRNLKDFNDTYRYIKGSELTAIFGDKMRPKSNSICLKPNKSETIRELLNQMKLERAKNNNKNVMIPMLQYDEARLPAHSMIFSSNQLKQLNKYKKFVPFREDKRLLIQKIGQKESIWKRKFKESWKRRKVEQEARRTVKSQIKR